MSYRMPNKHQAQLLWRILEQTVYPKSHLSKIAKRRCGTASCAPLFDKRTFEALAPRVEGRARCKIAESRGYMWSFYGTKWCMIAGSRSCIERKQGRSNINPKERCTNNQNDRPSSTCPCTPCWLAMSNPAVVDQPALACDGTGNQQ